MALGPGWTGSCCSYWQSFISLATLAVSILPIVAGSSCLKSFYLDASYPFPGNICLDTARCSKVVGVEFMLMLVQLRVLLFTVSSTH